MFKNKEKYSPLFNLYFSGVSLLFIAAYLQYSLMGLEGISAFEALKYNIISLSWWLVIGIPSIYGLMFLTIAVVINKNNLSSKNIIFLLSFVLGISIITVPFSMISGFLGILTSAVCLVSQIIYEKKHNKAIKKDV